MRCIHLCWIKYDSTGTGNPPLLRLNGEGKKPKEAALSHPIPLPLRLLTVEQAELQQRCQRRDDHEGEQAAAPAHQPHGRAQRQAGGHGDAGHGVVVGVAECGGPSLGVHHAASEAVVDPVTCQPATRTERKNKE